MDGWMDVAHSYAASCLTPLLFAMYVCMYICMYVCMYVDDDDAACNLLCHFGVSM